MSKKSTNQVIAEWMGICNHQWEQIDAADSRLYWNCSKCHQDEVTFYDTEAADIPKPDYESDLNAVREAELKAVEVFGWRKFIDAYLTLRYKQSGFAERPYDLLIVADAQFRAEAVRKLIEG